MINVDLISKKVYQNINEESVVVYYNADLNDIPSFMCSPFSEGWFWSNEPNDLVKYIFEVIIAEYLVDDVMAFGDYNNVENIIFSFELAVDLYLKYKKITITRTENINKLKSLYKKYIDKKINYLDFLKLLIELENITPQVGVDLKFESYISPLEARHSNNLRTENFDFKKFENNF